MLKQIVICGFSRSGSTLLYNMMRYSAPKIFSPGREAKALNFLSRNEPEILSKRPLDIFEIQELAARNAGRKDIRLILTVRDPRALISSMHWSSPGQWFQGFDHCFLVNKHLGYLKPGVLDTHSAIVSASQGPFPTLVCRFEDLIRNPIEAQQRIANFTGLPLDRSFSDFHEGDIPEPLNRTLNGVRPIDQSRLKPWLSDPIVAERVVRQFRLAPELFNVLEHWGYETNRDWFDRLATYAPRGLTDTQGTIITFYTEGTRYAHEAKRLEHSVRRLGLPFVIKAVPNLGSWIENVRYKAQFLADARAKMRGRLLWVDVDAVIYADFWPYLSGYDADLAVATGHDCSVISGTIFLNDTPGCLAALVQWNKEIAADQGVNDQVALERAVEFARKCQQPPPFQVQYLPPSLCYIFDHTKKMLPLVSPIIEHLMASREGRLRGRGNQESLARRRARVAEVDAQLGFANSRIVGAESQDHDLNPSWRIWLLQECALEARRFGRLVFGKALTTRIFNRLNRLLSR